MARGAHKARAAAAAGPLIGVPATVGALGPAAWAEVVRLWRAGTSTAELARLYGLDEAQVIQRLKPLMTAQVWSGTGWSGDGAGGVGGGVGGLGRVHRGPAAAEFARAPEQDVAELRERDEAHQRAAMAAGGFPAWTEHPPEPGKRWRRLSAPLIWPEGGGPGARRPARGRRAAGRSGRAA